MFESLQKKLLGKALGKKPDQKPSKKEKRKETDDYRTVAGVALDDAINKLENSGQKMDDLLLQNEELLEAVKAEASKKMTPERRALIESAQRVKRQKAKILEDLDDESRVKLYLTAIRAITGKDI
ncbi:hypothetical protein [Terasakiella pusilla]|uniref:hypothetical protein n=1 Tax=Terasakiella pusilla TaxID=64973 RepID=UPI000492077C|nr:hypothetical protein [Terasakiella pusilla]